MSDPVLIAIITVAGGVIGGIIGAIGSPLTGKDWVDRRAAERAATEATKALDRALADESKARERQLYEDLRAALETWRAVAPFVANVHSKAAQQFEAQERVRSLGPRVADMELRQRLQALVAGNDVEFWELHDAAVARLGEVMRQIEGRA